MVLPAILAFFALGTDLVLKIDFVKQLTELGIDHIDDLLESDALNGIAVLNI